MASGKRQRDPLLVAARVVITVVMLATLATAAFFVIALGALLVAPDLVIARLAESGRVLPQAAIGPAIQINGLLIAISLLSFAGQRLLRRLIDSVGAGDPFVPENARRLARMGWITLAVQVLALVVGALAGWVEHLAGPLSGQFGFSFGGVLLALVLFVLARVFRQGAIMREELEGTV